MGALKSLLILLPLLLDCAKSQQTARVTYVVSVLEEEGFCMLDANQKWTGLVPDLVNEIGKVMNFEPKFVKVEDGRYGAFDKSTRIWSGLIGTVVKGDADFAAAAITATSQREQDVDFSHEFLDTGLAVLIKKPEFANPIARSAAFFLSVYDAGVWAAVILVFLLTSFLIFLNDRYNPREYKTRQAEHNSRSAAVSHNLLMQMNDFSLFGSLFYVVSTGCFQGYRRAPQSLVGRSLSVFWWIFSCLFAAAYVAGLLCALVASRGGLERQFPLQELTETGPVESNSHSIKGFTPAWLPNGSTHAFFKNADDGVFRLIYQQYEEGLKANTQLAKVRSLEGLLDLVKSDGRFYAVVESVMADYYSRRSGCDLIPVGNLLNDRSYAFAFPHGSNLTRRVNAVLLRLRESGYVRAAYWKYFLLDTVQCGRTAPSDTTITMSLAGEGMAKMFRSSIPVTLRSFSGPILFYFISLLVSAAAVLADIYIYTRHERYRQGSQPFQSAPEQHDPEPEEPSFGALTFSDHQRLAQRERAQET